VLTTSEPSGESSCNPAVDGASASITRDAVTDIRDVSPSLYGCQFGVAILVGREYWPTSDFSSTPVVDFVGTATISRTAVSGYQKAGIVVDGPGSSASVSDNTVTGAGPSGALGTTIVTKNQIASTAVTNTSGSGSSPLCGY
jgi:hypothetical protein